MIKQASKYLKRVVTSTINILKNLKKITNIKREMEDKIRIK